MTKKTSAATDETDTDGVTNANASRAPINERLSSEERIGFYRLMVRIRRFEERSLRAYQAKKIGGFLHLYIGQEALAVGCCSLMGPNDHIITAYRDHGHALAVGMDMKSLMAELYGKTTGCSKGKGGSMHFFDPSRRYWGGHGVVGGHVPLGVGLAYAIKYRNIKGMCMTFMGDGAVNQGAVHESYNLAALWNLPIVFVIENNGYSMGTSQARSSAGDLAKRAEGYGMPWAVCNGQDVYEVRSTMDRFVTRAREESKPAVVEIKTYRFRGHSVADPDNTYRSKTEIEEYRHTKDPIVLFHATLVAGGVLNETLAAQIDTEARAEADTAANFAEASPFPSIEEISQDIYWEEDNPSEKKSRGRIFFD